jgi:hypothetical protein
MNGNLLIDKLNELEKRSYNIGNDFSRNIANKHVNDIRFRAFFNFAQVLRSFKIYFILKEEYLKHREWYVEIYLSKWGQSWPVVGDQIGQIVNDHNILNHDFDHVMLIGYIQVLFSIIDSGFRLFTQTINPLACNKGTDSFLNIKNWLLKKINKKNQYDNLLNLFVLIRNTIHNNGVYLNEEVPRQEIPYRRKVYTFENKKVVKYGSANQLLFFEITPDIITMLEDIVKSDIISKGPSIPDPIMP